MGGKVGWWFGERGPGQMRAGVCVCVCAWEWKFKGGGMGWGSTLLFGLLMDMELDRSVVRK